ncbi:hypothetical protein [Deinococcus misasensis]|uniref:hypothetical protein n=1 Tax=Deinococcus misasensis TaxID=392413 RepID=UPI000558C1FD|nr:hypothetical protein [Deinococcus misasensis]
MVDASGRSVVVGDVVQVYPEHRLFGGCFLQVTEVRSWGVQGCVEIPQQGQAFCRLKSEEFRHVGRASWVRQ